MASWLDLLPAEAPSKVTRYRKSLSQLKVQNPSRRRQLSAMLYYLYGETNKQGVITRMVKVIRMFEEEKKDAIREAVERTHKESLIRLSKQFLDVLSPELIANRVGMEVKEFEKLLM